MKYLFLTEKYDQREEKLFASLDEAIIAAKADWNKLTVDEKWNGAHLSVWAVNEGEIKEDGTIMAYCRCYAEYLCVHGNEYID